MEKDVQLVWEEVMVDSTPEDFWTCGCLYKCNTCLELEKRGGNKREYFEKELEKEY